jgi:glutamate-1-semialdehyde 2,1-aminomutase
MIARAKSDQLFAEALQFIPGGVNSPVRAFRAVGGHPFFVERAEKAHIFDVDGNEYVDYVGTWGPAILGHAHPRIIRAVQQTAERGTSFGIPNPLEVTMAKLICSVVPSVEKVRLCNSGTEAAMSAIRVARGFTRRDKIIKFEGCYHGHADSLLVKAGSGALTFGYPDSLGVPAAFTQHTIVLPFNEIEPVKQAFAANPGAIAGIILEPVPGNAGVYLPQPGFLESLREITAAHDALLIFDEVMTGFRLAWGGAQQRFSIQPDLTCFGKIIGGGLPVGAFGGRAEIMDQLAPLGPVYQAGTLSGNPLAMAAGIAALEELRSSGAYDTLEQLAQQLAAGMTSAAKAAGVAVQFNSCGSMFCAYFTDQPVHNLADAMHSDRARFARFFHGLLERGVYIAPSQFEAGFLSTAHTTEDIERTVRAVADVFRTLG